MEDVGVCFYERCNNASLVDTPASFNCSAFSLLKPRFYAALLPGYGIWNHRLPHSFCIVDNVSDFSGGDGLSKRDSDLLNLSSELILTK